MSCLTIGKGLHRATFRCYAGKALLTGLYDTQLTRSAGHIVVPLRPHTPGTCPLPCVPYWEHSYCNSVKSVPLVLVTVWGCSSLPYCLPKPTFYSDAACYSTSRGPSLQQLQLKQSIVQYPYTVTLACFSGPYTWAGASSLAVKN